MLKTLVVLIAIVCVANATRISSPLIPMPERFKDQKGCYIPELKKVLAINEKAPSNDACAGYLCKENSYEYDSCEINIGESFTVCEKAYKSHRTDSYPGCCADVRCSNIRIE